MMDRERFIEKVSQWLDDDLSRAEITELQQCLDHNAEYRQIYHTMQQMDSSLRQASRQMVDPAAGFQQRFESRLKHHQARSQRRTWLAVVALLLGSLLMTTVLISMALNGVTFIANTPTLLDVQNISQWQVMVIEMADSSQAILNLMGLLLKAGFITMTQPFFWLCAVMSLFITGIWLGFIQRLYRQQSVTLPIVA